MTPVLAVTPQPGTTFYAVQLRLLMVKVHQDATRTVEEIAAHHDGTLLEAEARARYGACDVILCAADDVPDATSDLIAACRSWLSLIDAWPGDLELSVGASLQLIKARALTLDAIAKAEGAS